MHAGPLERRAASLIPPRILAALLFSITAATIAACGGSTAVETVVGPDATRCRTTVTGQPATVPFSGGNVTVSISAARDCTWSANTEASWLQLGSTSGQGNGTVAVTVAGNEAPATRSGAVVVNDQRFTISQEARPCSFELRASVEQLSASGGRGTIAVNTLAGCSWTASSSAEWLRVLTSSGSGNGTVEFEAAANTGEARQASIAIGGKSVTIGQSSADAPPPTDCTLNVSPNAIDTPVAGDSPTIAITTNPTCDWTATSNAAWITFASPATGRGNGSITATIARNTGNARSGRITIGSRNVTVNQAGVPACTIAIDPATHDFPASGGDGRVRVTTQEGCDWTVSGGANWTSITNGRGSGSGEARYTVDANTATASRSTTLTIGGRSHTVTQHAAAPTCTYTLDPTSRSFPAAGGETSVTVRTQDGCEWTASGAPSWVTVRDGRGTGTGQFSYTVETNSATSSRSGAISVAGETHAITQEAATPTCTFTLDPASRSFPAAGGDGSVTVRTQDGCEWTASGAPSWVNVTGGHGTGTGQFTYTLHANSNTSPRSGEISVAGQAHTVSQEAAAPTCTYSLQPASQNFPATGGNGRFNVVTEADCPWTVSSGAPWAEVRVASGRGPGEVTYDVQANTQTDARQTTVTVNGQSHAVTQEGAPPPTQACTFSIEPASRRFDRSGGEGTVMVTTRVNCGWTASAPVSWISLSTAGGTGTGELRYNVDRTNDDRSATITVAGHGHQVIQER